MRYRILGRTGLKVSVIGFGGIKLPKVSESEAAEMLNRALDLGVNFIDTARAYGDSERKIGAALRGRRDEFYISSRSLSRDRDGLLKDLKVSMRELQTDYIDVYELHAVNSKDLYQKVVSRGGAVEGLRIARQKGLIGHTGITIHYDLDVMRMAIESGEFDVIMLAYSPLDHESVEREGILKLAKEHGMGVIVMKPLLGGQLVLPETAVGKRREDPLVRLSLKYVLSNPRVDVVIPGIKRVHEIEEDARVADEPLPITEEEKRQLFSLIASLGLERFGYTGAMQTCLRCGYCTRVCPQGIPVPEIFRAYEVYTYYPKELRSYGVKIYESLKVKPDACIECRRCIEVCPMKLDIPARIKEIGKLFERVLRRSARET